ncbi:MAG: flippase-like domain-containing protein, partial [Clostridiales bacterium]|nr:flippase-like domain-containing protein [Clostridiales bacterium]
MKKLPKSLKKQLLNLTFVVVLIAITITVLIVNFKEDGLSFENIGAFFGSANPYYIVAAFGCMVLFVLFEAFALLFIARKLGHKSKLYQSIAYAASDSYYSAITPSATGGQPASAFYMARDGMGAGKASFALVVNLVGHSFAIVFTGVMALILRPDMFSAIGNSFAQALIIFGAVIQVLLLGLFIACMFFGKVILKIGNWLIRVLTKIKIIKKPEKWQRKLEIEVEKFRSCRSEIKNHPSAIIASLIFNVLQRTAQFLIPVFICLSVKPDSDVLTLFSAQVLVFYGYSCVPIPGGVGAYELMYYNIYALHPGYDNSFILVAMMISRVIQYYICMLITGIYTWVYHMVGVKEGRIKA